MPTIKFGNGSSVVVTPPSRPPPAAPKPAVAPAPAPAAAPATPQPPPPPNLDYARPLWSRDETLHVAVAYCNPLRWKSRLAHVRNFIKHMRGLSNVRLYVAELAYGDRPFEVTCHNSPTDLQLRSRHELWHKENLLNLMVARFPLGWKYGAYCDGDFHFTRNDIGLETIQQLQRFAWVQMFSSYANLGPDHKPMAMIQSFTANYLAGKLNDMALARGSTCAYSPQPDCKKTFGGIGATGGAWAFRKDSFDACGGLLDVCILGSGDWHMAIALASNPNSPWDPHSAEMTKCSAEYAEAIRIWHNRAAAATKRNIGIVNCHAVHFYHGTVVDRGYGYRWKILNQFNFNPRTDIYRDSAGVWQLTPAKEGLRDAIRKYFEDRNEDAIPVVATAPAVVSPPPAKTKVA